jgi:Kef-type K+ transport system membrane component KefB
MVSGYGPDRSSPQKKDKNRMSALIIILLCGLLLLAYLFDLSASRTKIPSVILLLTLGWITRQAADHFMFDIPDFQPLLSGIGIIGLILIVLEGSLEIEFNRSKLKLIRKSFFGVLLSLFVLGFLLSTIFYVTGAPFKNSLIHAIPLCIISSAVIIPSVRYLPETFKEFVVYESSISDILGVMFFNFVVLNTHFGLPAFKLFFFQILIMLLLSLIATIALAVLLRKIEHHVKFIPIILLIILIYMASEELHLPALIFILIFGLIIGNLKELNQFPWISRFNTGELHHEVVRFKELTNEATFLVRALFFLLFGFMIETAEILNPQSFIWALGIVGLIYLFRMIQLKLSGLPLNPLIFMAPRGLITILLLLSIEPARHIAQVNQSLVVQIVLLTAIIMSIGLLTARRDKITLMENVQQIITAVDSDEEENPTATESTSSETPSSES